MQIVKPIYGQDYFPGTTLFTRDLASEISDGIAWFENHDEELKFVEGLSSDIYETGASHVVSVKNKEWGIESSIGGVNNVRLVNYFEDPNMLVVCREPYIMYDAVADEKLDWQTSKIGSGYDYFSYIGHLLAITTGLQEVFPFIRKLPPIGHQDGKWVCSTFEAEGFYHTQMFNNAGMYKKWNIHRIHVHKLWNLFPYKGSRFDKVRKGKGIKTVTYERR